MPWDYCLAGFGKRVSDYSVTLAANTNWHDLADIRLVQYGGGVGDYALGEGSATMVLLRQLLGDVLRRLRLRQGRTLREVSASARVSLGYLSEVERGQKEASSELLAAICGALNTPLSQVFREVSDNFALAELQNEPVLGVPREPGLRVPAEASVGLDGERGFVPISTMVPDEEFGGRPGWLRCGLRPCARCHRHGVGLIAEPFRPRRSDFPSDAGSCPAGSLTRCQPA